MSIPVRSFAKINIGLRIGPLREDGFHELRTLYQTIALHDTLRVDVIRGSGIEIRCKDQRVPTHETNTCWRVAERVMKLLKQRGKVVISIEKRLPVQGGIGAASSNGVATMLALERSLKTELPSWDRLEIAADVGSDLPLFLVGGTVLGIGRGEEVFPVEDLPALDLVLVTPPAGVSTPQAFSDWDQQFGQPEEMSSTNKKLTPGGVSGKLSSFSASVFSWLNTVPRAGCEAAAGIPAAMGGDRAGTLLLDLVRAGMENDFERVVFPKHPELREVKRALEREGSRYASLSGSGSTLYGMFDSAGKAEAAARALQAQGLPAQATRTLTRKQYWQQVYID